MAVEANFIVSGDKEHLLELRQFRESPLVSPAGRDQRFLTWKANGAFLRGNIR